MFVATTQPKPKPTKPAFAASCLGVGQLVGYSFWKGDVASSSLAAETTTTDAKAGVIDMGINVRNERNAIVGREIQT